VQNLATLGGSVYSLNQKQPQPMEDAFDVLFDGRHQQELDQVCDVRIALYVVPYA
jgi:hypothetical protein